MKKDSKKLISLVLALTLMLSALGVMSAGAKTEKTVKVTVQNYRMSTEDGAPWSGELLSVNVELKEDDSMETLIERAITSNGYEFPVSNYGYISSINGLAEYAYNGSGGWMATLNDWFTADGTQSYTVANNGVQAGDEIVMMYTCAWGSDVGSLYGDFNTKLSGSQKITGEFVSSETKAGFAEFDSETLESEIGITAPEAEIALYTEAQNKNYQVRIYLNEYQPEVSGADIRRGHGFEVKDGDTVYVGVGNPAWPSMNSWAGTADETVYTFKVKYSPVKGDLNGNGKVDIEDVTILQRHFAEFEFLTDAQTAIADFDGNGVIDLQDATAMQRNIAEFS